MGGGLLLRYFRGKVKVSWGGELEFENSAGSQRFP